MADKKEMPLVCDFSEIGREALPWVGGKGANLGEMVKQGFPVPPGFCVTTRAYDAFLGGEDEALEQLFQRLDQLEVTQLHEARILGKELRERLQKRPIPSSVEEAVLVAWSRHGEECAYAVRSSATAEDLPDASFAGQQDTYLNVRGQQALLERVRDCWASLFTDRALIYRKQQGFDHRTVGLSVVVQRMIQSDVSGILFTADPLTQNRNILSIDAGMGLGEALVSGKVSADLYKVDKTTGQELEALIADKHMAIRSLPEGGVVEEELSDEQRRVRVLSKEQISALVELGMRIEAHYGTPQDIEWCFEGDALYVVQSRPITSLYPLLSSLPSDGTFHVYMCFNHLQVMLDPIKPLGISVLSLLLPFGKGGQITTYNRFLPTSGGRIYIDLTEFLRHKIPHKLFPKMLTIADELIASSIQEVIQRPRFQEEMKKSPRFSLATTVRTLFLPIARDLFKNLWFKRPEGQLAYLTSYIDQEVERYQKKLAQAQPGVERLRVVHEHLGGVFYGYVIKKFLPVVAAGIVSAKLLGKLTGRDLRAPEVQALLAGLEGNVTTEMDLQLADLADIARRYPDLVECLRANPKASVLASLADVEGGDVFLSAFQEFLKRYGMRGPSEIDITRPRWKEEPTPLLQSLVGNLTKKEGGTHRVNHQRMKDASVVAGDALVQVAGKGMWGWLKSRVARRFVRVIRNLMGGREHPKFMLIRLLGVSKDVLREEAARLVAAGMLECIEDIDFLTFDEILLMAEGQPLHENDSWISLILERKNDFGRYQKLHPPRVLTSEGEAVVARHTRDDLPEGAIAGSAASSGIVEGLARVIFDPTDAILHEGEILVAPFTDPGWTPLFIHASGLVMEVGGMMTHGSVVAREYGIPAVVCVPDATKQIKTGQRLRVNGDSGYVEILD